MNESTKIKLKSKHNVGDNEKYALKEEEDDSGWKTDESSELSEEEYSYTKQSVEDNSVEDNSVKYIKLFMTCKTNITNIINNSYIYILNNL